MSEYKVYLWDFGSQTYKYVSTHSTAAQAFDCVEEKNMHVARTHMYVAARAGEEGLMEEHLLSLKLVHDEVAVH